MFGVFGPEPELPKDIPAEKLEALVGELKERSNKIGLYMNAVSLNVDGGDDDIPEDLRHHKLMAQFTLGDVAFSKRVQDPESDGFDTDFKKIEHGALKDTVKDIVEQTRRELAGDEDETDDDL